MQLSIKQTIALDYLNDETTEEVLFGGAAGGGKSILGCYWLAKNSLLYPESRWLMGRASLKTLRETTYQSFLKIAKIQGLRSDTHYKLTSAQDKENPNSIVFKNGSCIIMKDLFSYPSDPEFDELGSLEITGGFIDEGSQVSSKAKEIVRSRMRHNISQYGLIPKLLITSNPAKNWMYSEFYKPSKLGTLPVDKKFVQSLVTDNPFIDPTYINSLSKLKGASRARLLLGEWEYDDDPSKLIEYDAILNALAAHYLEGGDKYITADVARFGSDKTVIVVWNGWRAKVYKYKGLSTTQTAEKIKQFQVLHSVPLGNIIVDDDGVGGGVVDQLGCTGFVNNSSPLPNPLTRDKENYQNLKSQCYFMLTEKINSGEIYIDCAPEDEEFIKEELEQVKQHNMDKDGKKQIIPKDKVKELIGRSPDFADALMMRSFGDLKPKRSFADAKY